MKKQVLGLSLLASLVMGMTGVAHAAGEKSAGTATVTFIGSVDKGTCDVTLEGGGLVNIGEFSATDFTTLGTKLGGETVTLDFGNCKGDALTTGGNIYLKAIAADNNSNLTTQGLFGDASTNYTDVAVNLTAATEGNETAQPLKPGREGEVVIYTADADEPAASAVVSPAIITAALQSTVAKPKAGDIKSTVVFSAAYN